MAYRTPVEPRFEQTRINPVASPVDTYVHPAVSSAQQLVKALGEVEPKINRFSEEWLQKHNAESHERGKQAAREAYATGKQMGDLTREGALPMQENEWFKAGLQEETGRVLAGNWNSDFEAALASDPAMQGLRDSTSLADFDLAVQKHRAEFLKTNTAGADEFFDKGFSGLSTQYIQQQRLAFASGIEKKLGDQSDATLFSRVIQVGREEFGQGRSAQEIGDDLNTLVDLTITRGRPERFARKAAADAIDALARQQQDPEKGRQLLELFKHVKGLGGGSIADSDYGAGLLEKAENDLLSQQYTGEQRAFETKQREHKAQLDGFRTKVAEDIIHGGRGTKVIEEAPPELRDDLIAISSSALSANNQRVASTNPGAFNKAVASLMNKDPGMTVERISKLGGVDGGDKMRLLGLYNQMQHGDGSGSLAALKKLPFFTQAMSNIPAFYRDPTTGIVPAENATRVMNAQGVFEFQALQNFEELMKMAPAEQTQWLHNAAMQAATGGDEGLLGDLALAPPSPRLWDPTKPDLGLASIGDKAGAPAKTAEQPKAPSFDSIDAQYELPADEWGKALTDPAIYEKAVAIAQRNNVPPDGLVEFFATMQRKAAKGK